MPRSATRCVQAEELGQAVVRHHGLELGRSEDAPARARGLVRWALDRLATSSAADDAELVASELVTNALRHTAGGPVRMDLDVYRDTVVVRVHDDEHDPSAVHAPAEDHEGDLQEGGRGLYLIAALAEKWFVWPESRGKAVVAVMSLGHRRRTP